LKSGKCIATATAVYNLDADSKRMKKYWPWIIFLTLLFPILELLIFFVRFGAPEGDLYQQSLTFLPIGLLGSLVLFYFYDKAETRIHKNMIIAGFVLAVPFALLGALGGGLLGTWAVILYGLIPLVVGVLLGNWLGGLMARRRA